VSMGSGNHKATNNFLWVGSFFGTAAKAWQAVRILSHSGFNLIADVFGGSSAINKEETCSICYACEVDMMFIPCKHQLCQ
jgi:hypothetical protein